MKHAYIGYIPSNVRYDTNLSCRDKLLYCEITATLDDGYCTKQNSYFKQALNCSVVTITTSLRNLRDNGHINTLLIKDEKTKKFIKRYIWFTPINYLLGENQNINDDSIEKLIEGNVKKGRLVVFNANQTPPSTINPHSIYYYNNNIIDTMYTNDKKFIPLMKEINKKQYQYLYKIVNRFYNKQHKIHSKLIPKNWSEDKNLVNESVNNLYKLITIDNFVDYEVSSVIEYALLNNFWSRNLLSLRSLRRKSRNGMTKFANIYAKWSAK